MFALQSYGRLISRSATVRSLCPVRLGNYRFSDYVSTPKRYNQDDEDGSLEMPNSQLLSNLYENATNASQCLSIYSAAKTENPDEISIEVVNFTLKQLLYMRPIDLKFSLQVFHKDIPQLQLTPNEKTYGFMIRTQCKENNLEKAIALLDEMVAKELKPDPVIFSALIMTCGWFKQYDKALDLIKIMVQLGCPPNIFCLNAAIIACGKASQHLKAVELLRTMKDLYDVDPDLASFNETIKACSISKDYRVVLELFGELRDTGILPDLRTFNEAIHCCNVTKQPKAALRLLNLMNSYGVKPDVFSYNHTISSFTKVGDYETVAKLIRSMEEDGVQPNVVTFSSAILSCAQQTNHEQAIHFFDQMVEKHSIKPNSFSYSAMISVLGSLHDNQHDLAMKYFRMSQQDDEQDVVCYNNILNSCRTRNNIVDTWKIYLEMLEAGIEPNIQTFTILVASCAKHGESERVQQLMEKMKMMGGKIKIDTYFVNSMIYAYAYNQNWEMVDKLFLSMQKEYNLKPDLGTYSNMVKGFCKTKGSYQFERAKNMLLDMEQDKFKDGIKPNLMMYHFVLHVCVRNKVSLEDIDLIVTQMKAGRKDALSPDTLNILFRIYVSSGAWDKAVELLCEVDLNRKQLNCSYFRSVLMSFKNVGRNPNNKWREQASQYLSSYEHDGKVPSVEEFVSAVMKCKNGGRWDLSPKS